MTYQITDTPRKPRETAVADYTGNLQVDVSAQVDVDGEDLPDLTRLEGPRCGADDNDGSRARPERARCCLLKTISTARKTLDYIVIRMPRRRWLVRGTPLTVLFTMVMANWLIPAAGPDQ